MRKSYHITDADGKKIGVLFLDASSTADKNISSVFQSVSSSPWDDTPHIEETIETRNFWASDGITAMILGTFIGGVLLVYSWYYSLDGGAWIAAGAIVGGVGLHALKIFLHRPPRLEQDTSETKHTIQIETVENNGNSRHVLLDDIQDTTISLDELRRVARAYADGTPFSRSRMMMSARISQGKYRKILSEFTRLNLIHTDNGNKNHLSLRGKSVLKQIISN